MKMRTLLAAGAGALVAYRIRQRGWRLVEHDLVDHPLMTLWPSLGDRLHDRDEPDPQLADRELLHHRMVTFADQLDTEASQQEQAGHRRQATTSRAAASRLRLLADAADARE